LIKIILLENLSHIDTSIYLRNEVFDGIGKDGKIQTNYDHAPAHAFLLFFLECCTVTPKFGDESP
jgi:hypothetical protein